MARSLHAGLGQVGGRCVRGTSFGDNRAVELAQRLEAIEKEIQGDIEVGTPDPSTIITDILTKLGPVGDTASAVAKYLGLETPVTLGRALADPDLRALVDGKREDELINYLSDALGVEPDEAHKLVVELACGHHRYFLV